MRNTWLAAAAAVSSAAAAGASCVVHCIALAMPVHLTESTMHNVHAEFYFYHIYSRRSEDLVEAYFMYMYM